MMLSVIFAFLIGWYGIHSSVGLSADLDRWTVIISFMSTKELIASFFSFSKRKVVHIAIARGDKPNLGID